MRATKPRHQQDLEFRLQTVRKWGRSASGFIERHAAFQGLGFTERALIKEEQRALEALASIQSKRLALLNQKSNGGRP